MPRSPRSIEVTTTRRCSWPNRNASTQRESRPRFPQNNRSVRKEGPAIMVTTTRKPGPPRTLMQAHEELVRIRPCRKAALSVWLSYYQHSVAVYEQIAKTDPGHDGEALY